MIKSSWKCPICDYVNSDDEDICEECGAYREETAYEAESDEGD